MKAKELAREIGVSEATMSLVLNGKPGISSKTREKVVQRIRELGYADMLRPVREEQTGSAGEIVGFVNYKNQGELLGLNSFFPLILDGIEEVVRENGCSLTIINIEREKVREQISFIREAGCAGFVLFATEMQEEDLKPFLDLQIPFVILDNQFPGETIDTVEINNGQGTYLAAKLLYKQGHRRIGYLSSGLNIRSFLERQNRATDALRMLGCDTPGNYVYRVGYPHETAECGMMDVLQSTQKADLPTAFLADNDLVAVGAMRAMKNMGYRIPDDFSVIGYDDRPICSMVSPKLTTVQVPRAYFGRMAMEKLIRKIRENSYYAVTLQLNGALIERETVRQLQAS